MKIAPVNHYSKSYYIQQNPSKKTGLIYSSDSKKRKESLTKDTVNFTNNFQTVTQKNLSKINLSEILITALTIVGLGHFFDEKIQNIKNNNQKQNTIPNIEYKIEHKGKVAHCAHQG